MPRFAIALALVLLVAPGAWAATPTDVLHQVFTRADRILTDPDTAARPLERLLAIRKLVNEAFDFWSAAELASGEHWRARTLAEQEEFTWLFADLLERAFVARMAAKAKLSGGTRIKYLDERVDGDTAHVSTAMSRKAGSELLLGYRLIQREGVWKIRDVTIDGVSLMANYRAQLDRVLGTASYPELLTQMRAMVGTSEPPPAAPSTAEVTPSADGPTAEAATPTEPTAPVVATAPAEATPAAEATAPAIATPAAEVTPPVAATPPVAVTPAVEPAPTVAATSPIVEASPRAEPAPPASVPPPAPVVAVETVPAAEAAVSRPELPVSVEPVPVPKPRVVAVEPVRTTPSVEPPQVRPALQVETVPPPVALAPRRLATKAYWLKISTVEESAAKLLANRLRDAKHHVALERRSVSGKQMVQVSVGPFKNASEAIVQLLALQTKGHNPSLIAERE